MPEAEAVAAARKRSRPKTGRPKGKKDSQPRRTRFKALDIARAIKAAEMTGWQQVRLDKSGDIVLVKQPPVPSADCEPGEEQWNERLKDLGYDK